MRSLECYREVWLIDFEFTAKPGERPVPICLVAKEVYTGRTIRLWEDELHTRQPPFDTGAQSLFVAYYASAEFGCFRALGWPLPERVLDLFAEFRNMTNGLYVPAGNGLVGALVYLGFDSIDAAEKKEMQELAMRGGPWTDDEREALLQYCESDVVALARLLPAMMPQIFLRHGLLRGRFMKAASAVEFSGIPVNSERLTWLLTNWEVIQERLIQRFDPEYGIFEGLSFREARFETWLADHGIPWPRLESGVLDTKEETFQEMAKLYPAIIPLKDLRYMLSQLRLNNLAIGADGRNRCLLSPFASTTSRNQPSSAKYIFGPSVWIRNLIEPPPGYGLAYVDWSQQEFAIAAVLSGDARMQAAYQTGNSFLAFGKEAKLVPAWATKKTHAREHEFLKTLIHGIDYGMKEKGLSFRLNRSIIEARQLLEAHQTVFAQFWKWSENAVNHAVLNGWQATVFGWTFRIAVAGHGPEKKGKKRNSDSSFNPRSLLNFWMQGHGAEMLRLACCLGVENGIEIVALVHDAFLICSPLDRLDYDIQRMQGFMAEASRIVLDGFELRSDARPIRYPDRYSDPRGEHTWREISSLCDAKV